MYPFIYVLFINILVFLRSVRHQSVTKYCINIDFFISLNMLLKQNVNKNKSSNTQKNMAAL